VADLENVYLSRISESANPGSREVRDMASSDTVDQPYYKAQNGIIFRLTKLSLPSYFPDLANTKSNDSSYAP
jgi:hypothetical protein